MVSASPFWVVFTSTELNCLGPLISRTLRVCWPSRQRGMTLSKLTPSEASKHTAHADISNVGGAAGQDAGISRRHVPVIANHGRDTSIQVVANHDLFAGVITVKIHDCGKFVGSFLLLQYLINYQKWVVHDFIGVPADDLPEQADHQHIINVFIAQARVYRLDNWLDG